MITASPGHAPKTSLTVVSLLCLFFALFGPKLFEVFDLMVFVPGICFVLLVSLQRSSILECKINRIFSMILFFQLLILLYALLVLLYHSSGYSYFVMRSFRTLVSSSIIFLFFYVSVRNGFLPFNAFVNALVSVFMLGALVVYIQAFVPTTQPWFAALWGFDKGGHFLRAFGMSAGYDTMGYLLAFGACAALGYSLQFTQTKFFYLFIFVSLSVFFTSRSSMLVLLGLILVTLFLQRRFVRLPSVKVSLVSVLVVGGAYFVVWPIILATLIYQNPAATLFGYRLSERFAVSDVPTAVSAQYFLPGSFSDVVFGMGGDVAADPGYMSIVFYGGMVFLFVYLLFYWIMYGSMKAKVKTFAYGMYREREADCLLFLFFLFRLLLIVTVIGNLKNLYFFTRGYHELTVILIAVFVGYWSRWNYLRGRHYLIGDRREMN